MKHYASLLLEAYRRAHRHFGDQHWWPGDTPFEVMVGAVLTQNTNWTNVEKAIANLKRAAVFTPKKLYALHPRTLASLIRPAGYFNVKTKRLRNFLQYFLERYDGDVANMTTRPLGTLRNELLMVKGIGPETADSILLYAVQQPTFVVDAYTHRILHRHYLAEDDASYEDLRTFFMDHLPADVSHFNDFHAQLVAVGKHYCRPNHPRCTACPLNGWNWERKRVAEQ